MVMPMMVPIMTLTRMTKRMLNVILMRRMWMSGESEEYKGEDANGDEDEDDHDDDHDDNNDDDDDEDDNNNDDDDDANVPCCLLRC